MVTTGWLHGLCGAPAVQQLRVRLPPRQANVGPGIVHLQVSAAALEHKARIASVSLGMGSPYLQLACRGFQQQHAHVPAQAP